MEKLERQIYELLEEQKDMLNSEDYEVYAKEFGGRFIDFAEDVENLDLGSAEANVSFEQGYMYALKNILTLINDNK